MIRTTALRSSRTAALVGAVGLLTLVGCAGAPEEATEPDAGAGDSASTGSGSDSAATGDYADGTYTAEGSYQTPETIEKISVTLTLTDGKVTGVEVTGDPQAPETERYQGEFIAGIADVVEGIAIDELSVSKVAGSSLTSGGFNQALADIKEQAAA